MIATILLVETDPGSRAALGNMLRRAGYHLLTAPDRAGGRQTAIEERPDLVIVNLHGDDGSRLRRELSADPRTGDTPVLLLSTTPRSDSAVPPADGAGHYLPTPLPFADLLRHIDALLRPRYAAAGAHPTAV